MSYLSIQQIELLRSNLVAFAPHLVPLYDLEVVEDFSTVRAEVYRNAVRAELRSTTLSSAFAFSVSALVEWCSVSAF